MKQMQQSHDEMVQEFERRLEAAIQDKEDISQGYAEEIEQLELALAEAVKEIESLQAAADAQKASDGSTPLLKYRTLQEVFVTNRSEEVVSKIPKETLVLLSDFRENKSEKM